MPPSPPARGACAVPSSRITVQVDRALAAEVDAAHLRRVLTAALATEGRARGHAVDLRITDEATIHALNRDHRGVDSPTDVLSFPLLADPADPRQTMPFILPPAARQHLGDIVISWPRAEAQAAEFAHSVDRETAYLVVHGLLHLLGYDHEEPSDARTMRAREELILQNLGLAR
jgi:probable rRNA maturation factor